ncbi:MAG: hypothetical protein M3081_04325 [Gemmatimonadota bacterium]|nr:hypothetical protein [Gemmatimonadota bacterium]
MQVLRLFSICALAIAGATLLPAQSDAARARLDSVRAAVARLHAEEPSIHVSGDSVTFGDRTIAAGDTVAGDLAVFRGKLDVAGTVLGDVVVFGGPIVLRPGARVAGNVLTIGGRLQNLGAEVGGEQKQLGPAKIPTFAPFARVHGPKGRAALVGGWFAMLAVVGVAISLFARSNLEQIADRVQDDFAKSFLFGLLAQFAILPGMIAVVVALTLTVIGILVVPFAVVGIILAAMGAVALGFLTVAYVSGSTFITRRGGSVMGQTLWCLLCGLTIYGVLWMVAAVPSWGGAIGGLIRLTASIITWVAVTVGFGATILARGGTRGAFTSAIPLPASADDDYSWQTPTPVTGVAAARRPTPAPRPPEP